MKFIRDSLIIIGITVALLAGAEFILRILFPGKSPELARPKSIAFEYDRDYLVGLKPGMSKTFLRSKENGGELIQWTTNKNSFRGPELLPDPAARIIVYGDSNIQARFSSLENTFVYRLGEHLKQNGMVNLETINAGLMGFGPDQSLIRFSREADMYHPDLVILHIFADNDFGDIVKNRLFDLNSEGRLVKSRYPTTVDQLLTPRSMYREVASSLLVLKAVKKILGLGGNEVSEVKSAVDVIVEYAAAGREEFAVYKASAPRKFSHFGDHYDMDVATDPESESARVKFQLMNRVLEKARDLANEKGVLLLVVIQPSIVDLTRNHLFSYEDLSVYPGYKPSNLTDAVERICSSQGIPFVNLFDSFARNEPDKLFFKGKNNHWNDLGQELAARETANYILRRWGTEGIEKKPKTN